jgi:hypothetical protein
MTALNRYTASAALFALFLTSCSDSAFHSNRVDMPLDPVQPVALLVEAPPVIEAAESIKLGLLLDTSSSMDGLINQAKSQLWNIVNKLASAESNGEKPRIEVALYEYGNDGLSAREGYIRQVSPFTENMDVISEKLFALTTNGGSEYCGQVIDNSLNQLDWEGSEKDLKLIVIAGNEEFTQGTVPYARTCINARDQGIVVNTIFCGNHEEGINMNWKTGADIAMGDYFSIDHNSVTVQIDSPYDEELAALNIELNGYYVYYGDQGRYNYDNNYAQDSNASGLGKSSTNSRLKYKSENGFRGSSWDMTQLEDEELETTLEEVDKKTLPEEYQAMSNKQIAERVGEVKVKREAAQNQIADLMKKRDEYVTNQREVLGQENALESALLSSIERIGGEKGLDFEEKK